jgi:hypothetical protein
MYVHETGNSVPVPKYVELRRRAREEAQGKEVSGEEYGKISTVSSHQLKGH